MRVRFIGFVLAATLGFSVGGCGSNNKPPMNAQDMTVTHDMVMSLNCLGYGGCVLDCLVQAGAMGDPTMCINACKAVVKKTSLSLWSVAYQCGIDYCTGVADASVQKCQLNAAMTQYVDVPGEPAGTCDTCFLNAPDVVLGDFSDPTLPTPPTGMCQNPKSPDCMGGMECMTKVQRCINDL
jgi:hypothetical protein